MLTVDAGEYRLRCDQCGHESEARNGDRNALRGACEDAGWRKYKAGGQWRDSCTGCVRRWASLKGGQGRLL